MAEDQGVCDLVGEECCTVIPMHTDVGGNLTIALEKQRWLRNEHVENSIWNIGKDAWWEWLKNVTWKQILTTVQLLDHLC